MKAGSGNETTVTAEVPLAFSPKKLRFSKGATFKGLKSSPIECTDVSFKPENAPSPK